MKKKSREKNKYLENENSFYDEIKPFLSFLEGFHRSKSNIFLGGESKSLYLYVRLLLH